MCSTPPTGHPVRTGYIWRGIFALNCRVELKLPSKCRDIISFGIFSLQISPQTSSNHFEIWVVLINHWKVRIPIAIQILFYSDLFVIPELHYLTYHCNLSQTQITQRLMSHFKIWTVIINHLKVRSLFGTQILWVFNEFVILTCIFLLVAIRWRY